MKAASTGSAVGTLHVSTLTFNPENPETDRMVRDPEAAHSAFCRVSNKPGSLLFLLTGANEEGEPVFRVQSNRGPLDFSVLGRQGLLLREKTEVIDLAQFEEGSTVSIEVVATMFRNRKKNVWPGSTVTHPLSLAKYCAELGLDPKKVTRLYRKGLVWEWQLEDGSSGTFDEGKFAKTERLVSDEDCKSWFMKEAFALVNEHGKRLGGLCVEFMSCLMGSKRIFDISRRKDGKFTRLRPVVRRYSAVVTVTNAEAFADRLTKGVGKHKNHGAGLVLANLV